jgi:hypothetical protein
MKYLVASQNLFGIFMIFYDFGEFCSISVFHRKREKQKKRKKACIGLVRLQQSHPNCKNSIQVEKKSPQGETHSNLNILHQEP